MTFCAPLPFVTRLPRFANSSTKSNGSLSAVVVHLEWHWCTNPGSWSCWWSNLPTCWSYPILGGNLLLGEPRGDLQSGGLQVERRLVTVLMESWSVSGFPTNDPMNGDQKEDRTDDTYLLHTRLHWQRTRLAYFHLQWHCTRTVSRTTQWLWPSLEGLHINAKSSTGCRGSRKSIKLMYKGVFYCSMMVVNNCINSADKW